MNHLVARVLQRIAEETGDVEESSKKSGPPPRWNEWLDAKWSGGKAKVPNPNSKTKDRFPSVTFSSALKDKGFFQKAMKQYQDWIKKEDKGSKEKPETPKKEEKSNFTGALAISTKDVDDVLKKYSKQLDGVKAKAKKAVQDYEKTHLKNDPLLSKVWKNLSEGEKTLHAAGHLYGELFEKSVLEPRLEEVHDYTLSRWADSSDNRTSGNLQGALASMGVVGHMPSSEQDNSHISNIRKEGSKDKELHEYLKDSYTFNQAVLKHLGIKELTVYRGVSKQIDSLKKGDSVVCKTREASSYSLSPDVADSFGKIIATKVPASAILSSSITRPTLGSAAAKGSLSESEVLILGGSTYTSHVY